MNRNNDAKTLVGGLMVVLLLSFQATDASDNPKIEGDAWVQWHRPADNPVFDVTKGNNHDSILFVEPELEYPYHLIISHNAEAAHL